VRPDDAVEAGGCIIDLRNGTIDATLDARLSLMELALREAGGEVQL
jgi:flagellar biosynthesis/type III secretory pathway protein FliH